MRKPVLFLLGIIYVVSILVVTFFGLQISDDQYYHYIEKVEIISPYDKDYYEQTQKKYLIKEYDDLNITENYVQLDYDVYPKDDDKIHKDKVRYYISYGDDTYLDDNGIEQHYFSLTQYGKVSCILPISIKDSNNTIYPIIYKRVEVTINTTDGSNKSDSIEITFKRSSK